jgi:antitoxin component of RelBE/YafQ-DinJ toxin-antitoxin module
MPAQYLAQEPKEEEREAISMKIPKDLKRAFHLWCVQRGITMTEAIESAIKKFLQE